MSMLEWVKKEKNPNLILFIHGLNGGIDTWSYSEEISFPSLIATNKSMQSAYDIACFNYFSTLTNTYGNAKSWAKRLFSSLKKKQKNLPVDEIAELLRTELEVNLSDYENIIFVAHSMGGLIAKACILKQLEEEQVSSVKGFISLAVPHSGAKIANIGGLISKNVQLDDLGVLSNTIDDLSRKWLHTPNTPKTKYIYAANDSYVDKKSALAIDSIKKDSRAVDEDHSSICKPMDTEQTIYKAVLKDIADFEEYFSSTLPLENFIDNNQFDTQFFVIKMVLADIHESIQGHAKEYFYNAELARKIFTSDADREKLGRLYKKIKHMYQEELERHISEATTSDKLISSVHSRIMSEDKLYLNELLNSIDSIHKKGMLHQLANKADGTILWSLDTCLNELSNIKSGSQE